MTRQPMSDGAADIVRHGAPALVKYEAARHALAEAHRVDEVKDIRDKALALAAYARQAKDSDMITWATEIKIRAERRVGELLRETAETGQRQTQGRPPKTLPAGKVLPTLHKLGVSEKQSHEWRRLAAIPEAEFERRINEAKGNPAAMTTEKILRPTPTRRPYPFEEEARIWAGVSGWLARAKELPSLDELRSVRPTGGLRTALNEHLVVANDYMAQLRRLRTEGWL